MVKKVPKTNKSTKETVSNRGVPFCAQEEAVEMHWDEKSGTGNCAMLDNIIVLL